MSLCRTFKIEEKEWTEVMKCKYLRNVTLEKLPIHIIKPDASHLPIGKFLGHTENIQTYWNLRQEPEKAPVI